MFSILQKRVFLKRSMSLLHCGADVEALQARIAQKLKRKGFPVNFVNFLLEIPEHALNSSQKSKRQREIVNYTVPSLDLEYWPCGGKCEFQCNFTGKRENCDAFANYDVYLKDKHESLHFTVEVELHDILYDRNGSVQDMDGGYSTNITAVHKNTVIIGLENLLNKELSKPDVYDDYDAIPVEDAEMLAEVVGVLQHETLFGKVDHKVCAFNGLR